MGRQAAVKNVQRRLQGTRKPFFPAQLRRSSKPRITVGGGRKQLINQGTGYRAAAPIRPTPHPLASTRMCKATGSSSIFPPRLKSKKCSLNKLNDTPGEDRVSSVDADTTELVAAYLISPGEGPAWLQASRSHSAADTPIHKLCTHSRPSD